MFSKRASGIAAACGAVVLVGGVARGGGTLLTFDAWSGSSAGPAMIYSNNAFKPGAGMGSVRVATAFGAASPNVFDGASMSFSGFAGTGPLVETSIGPGTTLVSQQLTTGTFSVTAKDGMLILSGVISNPLLIGTKGATNGAIYGLGARYTGGWLYDQLRENGGATSGTCSWNLLDISPAVSVSGAKLVDFTANATGQFEPSWLSSMHWTAPGGGSWGNAGNWSGLVPSGSDASASFTSKNKTPLTVTLDGDQTVGGIMFDNDQSYTIDRGSGGTLLVAPTGSASTTVPMGISVQSGTHTISAPLRIAANTIVSAAASSKLVASGGVWVAGGYQVDMSGAIELQGGLYMESGGKVVVDSGRLQSEYITGGAMEIQNDASVAITAEQYSQAMVTLDGLTLSGAGATMDVGSTRMMVRAKSGVDVLGEIVSQIVKARDSGWAGPGITSSMAKNSPDFLGLAAVYQESASASPLEMGWIVVRCTYNGDSNLDGWINADDYFAIDSGYIRQTKGYSNGDFNYDGKINADDFFLIDSAFIGQKSPLAGSDRPVGVPEPGTLLLAGLGVLSLRRRARR
ncbi:MAG: PEP-CTERM sorting domain-containing protein [Planctomycetota bacterium]|nr:PEP-CTERM sorting domain-containing protein [Planctomycetota bacterium]